MTDDPMNEIEMLKGMVDLARLIRAYYEELISQGFSKREAMMITLDYQRGIVRGGQGNT